MKERNQDQSSITDIFHINGDDKNAFTILDNPQYLSIWISGDGLLELIPDIYSAYPLSGKLFWEWSASFVTHPFNWKSSEFA
jgi:hypothetical protein